MTEDSDPVRWKTCILLGWGYLGGAAVMFALVHYAEQTLPSNLYVEGLVFIGGFGVVVLIMLAMFNFLFALPDLKQMWGTNHD